MSTTDTTAEHAEPQMVVTLGMAKQVKALRARVEDIGAAIGEWTRGQVVIGERYGWDNHCIAEYEQKIQEAQARRQQLMDKIAAIETPRRAA